MQKAAHDFSEVCAPFLRPSSLGKKKAKEKMKGLRRLSTEYTRKLKNTHTYFYTAKALSLSEMSAGARGDLGRTSPGLLNNDL